jgi:hypothetical protein
MTQSGHLEGRTARNAEPVDPAIRTTPMWLPIHHKKCDARKARDPEQDTDLSPMHFAIVRDI